MPLFIFLGGPCRSPSSCSHEHLLRERISGVRPHYSSHNCLPVCIQCVYAKSLQSCPTLQPHELQLAESYVQEYWSGLPCPPRGDLPDSGTKLASLMSPALADGFFTTSTTWEALAPNKSSKVSFLPPHTSTVIL